MCNTVYFSIYICIVACINLYNFFKAWHMISDMVSILFYHFFGMSYYLISVRCSQYVEIDCIYIFM